MKARKEDILDMAIFRKMVKEFRGFQGKDKRQIKSTWTKNRK